MWLLMLEALGAFFLLAFIVWWTMYSGRKPDPRDQKKRLSDQHSRPDKLE